MSMMPQMFVFCDICKHIFCQAGITSLKKSWEVESQRKNNHRENVKSGFLPGSPGWSANAQESFKGDGNCGVAGSSQANVEERVGELVDHSVEVGVWVAS